MFDKATAERIILGQLENAKAGSCHPQASARYLRSLAARAREAADEDTAAVADAAAQELENWQLPTEVNLTAGSFTSSGELPGDQEEELAATAKEEEE